MLTINTMNTFNHNRTKQVISQPIDKHQKFIEMLSGFDTAMLTTRGSDGQLSSRPMAVAKAEPDGDLWFVCNEHSGKVIDLEVNPLVAVTMQSTSQYLSMSGRARISTDRSRIDSLWNETWKVWFPAGKNDPSIALIQVIPIRGEFWDNSGLQGLKYLFNAGKAFIKGETLETDEEMNAKVTMESTWIEQG